MAHKYYECTWFLICSFNLWLFNCDNCSAVQKIYNLISLSAHMYGLITTAQLCVIGLLMVKVVLFYLENSEPMFWRRIIWFISQKNDHSGIQDRHGLVQEYHVYSEPVSCMNYVADHSSWWCLLSLCWSGREKCMASRSFFLTSHT